MKVKSCIITIIPALYIYIDPKFNKELKFEVKLNRFQCQKVICGPFRSNRLKIAPKSMQKVNTIKMRIILLKIILEREKPNGYEYAVLSYFQISPLVTFVLAENEMAWN